MNVYFFSGIAADERLFKYIRLPEGFKKKSIGWIPAIKKEPLIDYAKRLSEYVDDSTPFILAGISLGGIISIEVGKIKKPAATILFSSVPLSSQLPGYYHFTRKLRLHNIFPGSFFKVTASLKRLFTSEKMQDKKDMLNMIRESDPHFIKWAIDAVLNWSNNSVPEPFFHIHGTRDEVFPLRFVKPTHILPRAGHTLTLTHYKEINSILADILESLPVSSPRG